jgi:hypothetical protein
MKLFLALLLITLFVDLSGQDLSFSAGFEKTVAGSELHFSSGYVTKKNWSLGAFHQMKIENMAEENTNTSGKTGTWYGLYINAPIANTKKINVFFQLRTGLSENRFIVVVPSIETNINLSKVISLGIGSSFRYSYPGLSIKTNFRPFNQRQR